MTIGALKTVAESLLKSFKINLPFDLQMKSVRIAGWFSLGTSQMPSC